MKTFPLKSILLVAMFTAALFLSGCSSIARGVTEAVIDRQGQEEDTRQCEIEGTSFGGIRESLDRQVPNSPQITKVLMVHGISSHLPGYSSRFQKKLYENLDLTTTEPTVKTIQLDDSDIQWNENEPRTLGQLRVTRHADATGMRQLLFYELTWSDITDPQKQALATDSANNEGLARAGLNASLKSFMNATVPDLLIYNGNGYDRITSSVRESVCWMLADSWDDLPANGRHECEKWSRSTFSTLKQDDHFFVTHSLGSRITIDTIQNFSNLEKQTTKNSHLDEVFKTVRDKEFTVFMMANQLPLLQMGRSAPEISAETDAYCQTNGQKSAERVMRKMNIIAFSDPNDILSYPVPLDFTTNSIDSRICPAVTNVSLNIAAQKSLFDAASFANPLTAHSGYMEDDRVIDLIANGISKKKITPLIEKRCKWLEQAQIGERKK